MPTEISPPNYAKKNLDRYIRQVTLRQANQKTRIEQSRQLLTLLLALRRQECGLNLRWNKSASQELSFKTIEELEQTIATQKHPNPVMKSVAEAYREMTNGDIEKAKELMLGAATEVMEVQSKKQKEIAKNPRVRKEHIFKKIVRETVEDYPNNNHVDIRGKAIAAGNKMKIIYEVDEDRKKIIFEEILEAKDVTFPTVRGWIDELKKLNRK